MDVRFLADNSHWESGHRFAEIDPHLSKLKNLSLIHSFPELNSLPTSGPGIYTLCGGYKVGKTTLLKQWIEKLIQANVEPKTIAFFSGKFIKDYHVLINLLQKYFETMTSTHPVIIIDDVTDIHDWKKALKFFSENGKLQSIILMLASSNSAITKDLNLQFHAERQHAKMDTHLYPLSFHDTVLLKHGENIESSLLFSEFEAYLLHGGYLNAIQDIASKGFIDESTIKAYGQWLIEETLKCGRHENFLREIIVAITRHYNEQVTWNSLAQELTIDHPKTIGDYFAFLESMDVAYIQYALLESELKAAPKKARKLMFIDPFIFHALHYWITPHKNNFLEQTRTTLENSQTVSKLVETCVIVELRKYFPTFYIKGEGEVDLAYIHDDRFWPIEITWSNQMRAKDLKQILKYPNGRILTKTERSGIIEHIRTESLPLALWQIEEFN